MKKNYTVCVIDDDPLVNATVAGVLAEQYERVHAFTDCAIALDELDSLRPDVILLDVFLGEMNGLDVLMQLRERGDRTPVIMMTAFSDVKIAVRAVKLGAEDFIVKPLDLEQLELSVEKALHNYDLRRQVDILQERLTDEETEFIGTSERLMKTLQMAEMVARSDDTTALILGESGTGKELMAKFIHRKSPRARKPFISVNCGAIPRDLAENELFGYERGAFTGATEKIKPGRFEMAHKGTIFLDEVGELSLEMQVKLLRVLQERSFYRLGGVKEVSTDVRVIAATNRNLEKMVEEGTFRQDLFYRLNVAPIEMPALREIPDDIILIASAFLKEFSRKFAKYIEGFTPEAIELLRTYEWKGNIRELRNAIERVCLLATEEVITREALKFLRVTPQEPKRTTTGNQVSSADMSAGEFQLLISPQGVAMNDVMKSLILQTLQHTNGNQIKAAKILGISRAKFRYRLEQLGINPSVKLS